jgi:hypothetical protein
MLAVLLIAVAQALQPAPPATPPPPRPPACATPEHRQFDFWVGTWNVYRTGTEVLAGRNVIESLYGGCVIRESWSSQGGSGGSSFNSWLPNDRIWRQTWVDGSNSYAVFEGRYENDRMVLTGHWPGAAGPGTNPLVRMTYSRVEGGAVRQLGEQSLDGGQTWAPNFDFTYRPAATP